mgnify:CR=1 FL=1
MITAFFRTVLLYALLILGLRLTGKRQIGQLEPIEFVLMMLLSDLASVPMQDFGLPLLQGIVPIATLLAFSTLLSGVSLLSIRFRSLICGEPTLIVRDGILQQSAMKRSRLTLDEVLEELRVQGVSSLADVKYAVLENSGKAALYQILADFTANCGALLSIAVGKKCQLFQLSLSYQSALTALKYCRSSENGIAFFDDMTLEILLSSISEQEKNAYLQKTISALSDEERNLLQTYFEANMSLLGTSQKLFLHKNTVQYKLNHIYQKCGLNPRVFKDAVLLYLALQL